jgi:hypothetical protein
MLVQIFGSENLVSSSSHVVVGIVTGILIETSIVSRFSILLFVNTVV